MRFSQIFKRIQSTIQTYWNIKKSYSNLRAEYEVLLSEHNILKEKQGDPRQVVDKIFKNGIEWFDWNELTLDQHRRAYADAQHFLESDIINSIKNQLIATGAQRALLEEQEETRKIRDFQFLIVGLDLMFDMLGEIWNPDDTDRDKL